MINDSNSDSLPKGSETLRIICRHVPHRDADGPVHHHWLRCLRPHVSTTPLAHRHDVTEGRMWEGRGGASWRQSLTRIYESRNLVVIICRLILWLSQVWLSFELIRSCLSCCIGITAAVSWESQGWLAFIKLARFLAVH